MKPTNQASPKFSVVPVFPGDLPAGQRCCGAGAVLHDALQHLILDPRVPVREPGDRERLGSFVTVVGFGLVEKVIAFTAFGSSWKIEVSRRYPPFASVA